MPRIADRLSSLSWRSIRLYWICLTAVVATACIHAPEAQIRETRSTTNTAALNPYVLAAVDKLSARYGSLGYGTAAFTHDLSFGQNGQLSASQPPLTMCVAAQLEVLVEALNLQASASNDYRAFSFLPKERWQRLRPSDFRGQVWIVKGAPGHGMADALANFGMGETRPFESLRPGDFLNFNRENGSGHGVVFIGYLDATGQSLPAYSALVRGFQYFSSQGTASLGGLGYGYAFFSPTCPTLDNGRKHDCRVIYSPSSRLLNGGTAWLPSGWNSDTAKNFLRQRILKPEREGSFDPTYFTGQMLDH